MGGWGISCVLMHGMDKGKYATYTCIIKMEVVNCFSAVSNIQAIISVLL